MTAADQPATEPTTVTVPRPHVTHGPKGVAASLADADYLRAAVRNIKHQSQGERLWGSGVTAMVSKLLNDAADALLAPAPQPAAERHDGGWDEAQWEAWSNDVASEMPEEWDSDEGQEAIILRFVKYATAHLATCPTEVEPAADTERDERLRALGDAATKNAAAIERMYEIGQGVGGLGVQNREMFEDHLDWVQMSDNDHADTVLDLLAEVARQAAVIQNVRDMHKPRYVSGDAYLTCDGCGYIADDQDDPCPTVRALDGAEQ